MLEYRVIDYKEKMNLNNISNTALLRLFLEKGDSGAICLFFKNQSDLFYRVALKYTRNTADAEDVLQTACIRISEKAYQYKGLQIDEEKLLQSWCLSIVVHCALKKINAETNRRKKETNFSHTKPIQEEKNMATKIDQEVVHQKVQNAISQLPETFRIPIHLKYVEGFELDAIATILKLNANTLRSNIKRGLAKLAVQLKEENITLSSIGLIGIIENLPLEKAPLSFQAIVAKKFESVSSSRRLLANSNANTIFHSFYFYASLIATCLVVTAGTFYWNILKTDKSPFEKNLGQSPSQIVTLSQKDTNQSWSFKNESDRNLTLLMGSWEWSNEFNSMLPPLNTPIMISLPISIQEKPFVIEYELRPFLTKEISESTNLLRGYWIKNNEILKHEVFKIKEHFFHLGNKQRTERIYFYQNYICVFRGDQSFQLNKYLGDLNGANVSIISNNYMHQKISSKTLNSPPDELLEAIKNRQSHTSSIQESWPIVESKFKID